MRILAIAPQPFFTPRGTPFSVYHRTRVTAALGTKVDLLTYGEGEDPVLPGVRIVRIWRLPFLGAVKVGPSFGKLARDVLMVLWTVALLARHRYDAVHAHEEAVFWCRFLKPLFRYRLIYDMHSSLPQQLTNFEFTESSLLIGLFARLEDASLRASDAVITISPQLAAYAEERMPDPSRQFLIENSLIDEVELATDANGAADIDVPPLPEERRWIVYAGTFEAYQGLSLLIRAFETVVEAHPDAHLVLVGGDDDQVARYRCESDRRGLQDDVTFTGRLPHDAARRIIRRAAVMTSPRISGTNTPLKVYELLASGVPFVATRIASHTQVLDESVCFLVEPEPRSLADGIMRALDGGRDSALRVEAARRLYEERYSGDAYAEKLRGALMSAGWSGEGSRGRASDGRGSGPGVRP